jgi:hypothetical protein
MGSIGLSVAEANYYSALKAMKCDDQVGLGLVGAGITTTKELKVLTFKEAISSPEKEAWTASFNKEYDHMKNDEVFMVVESDEIPSNADIIDSTWSMKKKQVVNIEHAWKHVGSSNNLGCLKIWMIFLHQ